MHQPRRCNGLLRRRPPADELHDPGATPLGLGRGSRIAVLSKNRPEVLSNIAATFLNGGVLTPLHPLGSLDDHTYTLRDSGE